MSQHLIHVCVTDAPAGTTGMEAKAPGHRNPIGLRRGKTGEGWGKRQHNGANEKGERERERKADKKTEIWLIRFLRETKPNSRGGAGERRLRFRCCFGAQRLLLLQGWPWE